MGRKAHPKIVGGDVECKTFLLMHMTNWNGYVLKVNTRQRETTRDIHPKEFNNSGVYILTSFHNYDDLDKGIFGQQIGDKDRVQVYAGQARHFDSRTNDPKRLNDQDFFYLIGIKCPPDFQEGAPQWKMDENWRQHLEHKLIAKLKKNATDWGFDCTNNKGESRSFADDETIEKIEMWYEKLERILEHMECPGFVEEHTHYNLANTTKRHWDSMNSTKKHFKANGWEISSTSKSSPVRIVKGSLATFSRWQIAIRYQEIKSELISENILKKRTIAGKDYYEFQSDWTFNNKSEASAVITNSSSPSGKSFEEGHIDIPS